MIICKTMILDNQKIPTNREMVLHLLGYAIVDEIFFYASHRLAHHKLFYQHVHKLHHQWTSPIALSSDYCHPLEHLLVNVLPNISYGLIFGSDPFTYLIWWILVYLGSQSNHSGYRWKFEGSFSYYPDTFLLSD